MADDACGGLAQALVAFCGGKPAPQGGGEQVTAQLFACEVLQEGAGVLRVGLRRLQCGLGLGEALFELGELRCTDAPGADAYGGGLAYGVAFVFTEVPLVGVTQLRKAALAY